jgi:hypothetical protein
VSAKRQAELLDVSQASAYYRPRPILAQDLKMMRRTNELQLKASFYRSRKIAAQLRCRCVPRSMKARRGGAARVTPAVIDAGVRASFDLIHAGVGLNARFCFRLGAAPRSVRFVI